MLTETLLVIFLLIESTIYSVAYKINTRKIKEQISSVDVQTQVDVPRYYPVLNFSQGRKTFVVNALFSGIRFGTRQTNMLTWNQDMISYANCSNFLCPSKKNTYFLLSICIYNILIRRQVDPGDLTYEM